MAPSRPDKASTRTSDSSAEANFSPVLLNVLGYQEEDEWVALALEMDIRGYGDTFAAALKEVYDLALTQLGFAYLKGQPDLLWKPAEPIWFERFDEARKECLKAWLLDQKPEIPSYKLASLPLPPRQVLIEKSQFASDEDLNLPNGKASKV